MEEDRYTRITLRIPRELHARLDSEADRTSKSLNAEIVARLQQSFDQSPSAELSELKHLLSAQETEREVMKEAAGHLNKLVASHEKAILMLQTYLVSVINSLPKKLQSDEQIKVAKKFAQELDIDREN
jgi:transcription termination factor NusB